VSLGIFVRRFILFRSLAADLCPFFQRHLLFHSLNFPRQPHLSPILASIIQLLLRYPEHGHLLLTTGGIMAISSSL
jgi:hypothetical protein